MDKFGLGLAGAHGTGKTTLARAMARKLKIALLETNTTDVFRNLDLPIPSLWSAQAGLSFRDRMRAQYAILDVHLAAIAALDGQPFVSDSTTIDFAAYALCEWGMRANTEEGVELYAYAERCMDVAGDLYSPIVMVPPALPYKAAETRPQESDSYQRSLAFLICGMLANRRVSAIAFELLESDMTVEQRVKRTLHFWRHTRAVWPIDDAEAVSAA